MDRAAQNGMVRGARRGRPRRMPASDTLTYQAMQMLATLHMSASEVALALGCNQSTVTRAAERLGAQTAIDTLLGRMARLEARLEALEGRGKADAGMDADVISRMRAGQLAERLERVRQARRRN